MDPVPFTLAAAIALALTGAIGTLFGLVVLSGRECKERNLMWEARDAETQRKIVALHVASAEAMALRAAEYATILNRTDETARICARVLKRYDQTPIPPGTGETSALQRIVK